MECICSFIDLFLRLIIILNHPLISLLWDVPEDILVLIWKPNCGYIPELQQEKNDIQSIHGGDQL
jgi:hypothetical protein